MSQLHHAAPLPTWRLAAGRTVRLAPQRRARQLWVTQGRLWLTTEGRADQRAEDVVLGPGQWLTLPAGTAWVAEAWEGAGFWLMQAPPAACGAVARPAAPLGDNRVTP